MQLSRHADYALRIVLDLAPRSSSRIADIAQRRRAPSAFLAKIVRGLVRARLLRSLRGRNGGVTLARPASRITVLQVIEAADGPLALNRCVHGGSGCPLSGSCPAHPVWARLQKLVAAELNAVTIDSLLREAGQVSLVRVGRAGGFERQRWDIGRQGRNPLMKKQADERHSMSRKGGKDPDV